MKQNVISGIAPDAVARGPFIHSNAAVFLGASLVLLLPSVIFAMTTMQPVMAAIVAGGVGLSSCILLTTRTGALLSAPIDIWMLVSCLAASLILVLLGGEGHFFYSNWDWLIRDAVLADLSRGPSLPVYSYQDTQYLMRAPLGMYMLPASIGRGLGLHAAHMTLLAQNSFIVGVIAYFIGQLARTARAMTVALVFAFSGLDILPELFSATISVRKSGAFDLHSHIEWWADDLLRLPLQYSSHLTQLFWVPNHAAPGWWFALLTLLVVRDEIDIAVMLVSFAALLFWSPLAMMGAAPFIPLICMQFGGRNFLTARLLCAIFAGSCFLPIAFYLISDAASVPHGFLFGAHGFIAGYFVFIAIEIPQAGLVLLQWRKIEGPGRPALGLAIALLLIIPLYQLGHANDFVMRASITPLFLLAFSFARIVVLAPRDGGRLATAITALIILTLPTPLFEVKRLVTPAFAISDCNMLTSWREIDGARLPTNYWARPEKVPVWLMAHDSQPPLTLEARQCWPDHPFGVKNEK